MGHDNATWRGIRRAVKRQERLRQIIREQETLAELARKAFEVAIRLLRPEWFRTQ